MLIEMLPAALWIAGVALATVIIGITIQRGRIFVRRESRGVVHTVSWRMALLHIVSFVLAIVPFIVYALTADAMDPDVRDFYEAQALHAVIIIIAMVLLETVMFTLQARHAMEYEMDQRLSQASHGQSTSNPASKTLPEDDGKGSPLLM